MRSEQFERLLADMTDQELDALKEWNSGCYWGNKSAIDLINAEQERRQPTATARHNFPESPL